MKYVQSSLSHHQTTSRHHQYCTVTVTVIVIVSIIVTVNYRHSALPYTVVTTLPAVTVNVIIVNVTVTVTINYRHSTLEYTVVTTPYLQYPDGLVQH